MITKVFWLLVLVVSVPGNVFAAERLDFSVRGRTLALSVYRPASAPRGTVVMGSGDVGWVGLGPAIAEDLSSRGYIVVGVNIRQYLSVFTDGKQHLSVQDVGSDYYELRAVLVREQLLVKPVIVSGVSEGAAVAILAAADRRNHQWIDGVITMGLPPTAELAWRWTDVASWITKHDADEPSFAPNEFIAAVAPLPLFMLQSTKDEYVTEADYRRFEATAKPPRKLVLIDASNHRFTDKRRELHAAYIDGLDWIRGLARTGDATR
jgi:alpha-beta hydrolase superfamily lysophospholipase